MNRCETCLYNNSCMLVPYGCECYKPHKTLKGRLMTMLTQLDNRIRAVNVTIEQQEIYVDLTVNGWADTLVALDVYDYELVKIVENTLMVRKVV